MRFLEDMHDAVGRLQVFAELDVPAAELPASALGLSDSSVRDALAEVTGIARQAATLQSVLAGVAAARSGRERGHGGLVQEAGHRNAVEFVRDATGATRGEAVRAVRVGQALVDGLGDGAGRPGGGADEQEEDAGRAGAEPVRPPWHEPLRDALLAGSITTAQHHAIRTGLGEPPAQRGGGAGAAADRAADDGDGSGGGARLADEVAAAWRAAAAQLAREAAG
ncbi:MAG: hypothetical protein QM611_08140, partial [Microbacterium sp.]